jgi:hypothetical protein
MDCGLGPSGRPGMTNNYSPMVRMTLFSGRELFDDSLS